MSSDNTSMSSSSVFSVDEIMFGLGYLSDSEPGMNQLETEKDAIVEECVIEIQQAQQRYLQYRNEMMARHAVASRPQQTREDIERDREAGYEQLLDDYLRMGASTTRECLYHFVESMIAVFGGTYLRETTPADLDILKDVAACRGFPGMLGSVDCMHWEWKNCSAAWKGQFASRGGKATIILEAVAGYNTRIWHAFFGTPGSCNDINVLDRSPLFDRFMEGKAPQFDYIVNDREYHMGYYLTDGIYPKWAAFMPEIPMPVGDKAKCYTLAQESLRKDVERAFDELQGHFHIIRAPSHMMNIEFVKRTMLACIILHNMIIEDEAEQFGHNFDHTKHVREQGDPEWNPDIIP